MILVPGICGDQGSTWDPSDSESLGFKSFFRLNLQNMRVSTYNYPLFANDPDSFAPSDFKQEATRLLKAIGQLDRVRRQKIILAGHDVGGTLIKQVGFSSSMLP